MRLKEFLLGFLCFAYFPFSYCQTNYINNGGFESSSAGTSIAVAGNGTTNNSGAGNWQGSFVAISSTGAAVVVDTQKNGGSKSIYLNITKHTNRNDIKLIQVIPNSTIPPAAICVLTFYMKGANTGDSVVANVFKSTANSNANGVSGDVSQPANLFITTNYWKMYKMYVDLSTWTTAERTNMRISIRPNSGLSSSPTPSGPFPKSYWFDDISFMKIDTLKEMHDVAIMVAMDRKQAAQDAGFTAEATSLTNEIAAMQSASYSYPITPTNAIGFYPSFTAVDSSTNPFIAALNAWGSSLLGKSSTVYPKATVGNFLFENGPDARDLGDTANNLFWLVVSPYSKYRYNAELFKRMLSIVYATSDDYKINGNSGATGTPGFTPNGLNDWFAGAKTCYSWWRAENAFRDYIPSTLNQRLKDAADTMGTVFAQVATVIYDFNYTNRDVSYAEILMNVGLFRNKTTWINFAKQIVDSVNLVDRYPDGAYSYLGYQNETANYHPGTNHSLLKMWVVSGYQPAYDCVSKTVNYEILSIEPRQVPEFYTAPAWKSQWNYTVGYPICSAEPLLSITQNPYLKTKMDEFKVSDGANSYNYEMVLSAAFYKPNIAGLPLPENYVVYDRNIKGARGRYGNFSYGVSMRNVSPNYYAVNVSSDVGNLGMPTLVGAMCTQRVSDSDTLRNIINSAIMRVNTKVHVRLTTPANPVADWGFMMTQTSPKTCISRTASSASTPAQLQCQYAGPVAKLTNWSTNQHWITLPDRMIGYVETYPTSSSGTTSAYEITGRIRFTFGRFGSINPQTIVIDTANKQYTYGNLRAVIKGHNYNSIDTATAGVLVDADPYNAKEIVFICDSSSGGTVLKNYSGTLKKYYMVELKTVNSTGTSTVTKVSSGKLSGLIVKLNGQTYASYRNDSVGAKTIDLSSIMVAGNITEAHYSRNDSTTTKPKTITSTSFSLPAGEQVLIVSSSNLNDIGKGWENFDETLLYQGFYPNTGTTWNGTYNNSWNNLGNWSYGIPNDTIDATIPFVSNQPTVATTQSVRKLVINTNVSLNNTGNIQINDSLTNNGSILGGGIVSLVGSSPQKVLGNGTINNLTISNASGVSMANGSYNQRITNTLNLNAGTFNANGKITIASNIAGTASITSVASGAAITGNIAVERFIPAKTTRRYSFISSPVSQPINSAWQQQIYITGNGTGGTICGTVNSNGFDVTPSNAASMFIYRPQKLNDSHFVSIVSTTATNLTSGVGYKINVRGSRNNGSGCSDQLNSLNPTAPNSVTLLATGTYNSAPSVSIAGTSNYGGTPAYSLLGNPYPCAISATKFINANSNAVTNNLWLFANNGNSSGNYGSWNKGTKTSTGYWPSDFTTDNVTDLVIPSGAAFFVERTRSADTAVVFSEDLKVNTPKNGITIFGGTTDNSWMNRIRCTFTNADSTFIDDAVLLYGDDVAISDSGYTIFDTHCLNINSTQYMAIMKKGLPLSVHTKRNRITTDTVSLQVYSNTNGVYRLHFSEYQGFTNASSILLMDKFLNIKQDIKAVPYYTFNTTTDSNSFGSNRFQIIINPATTLALNKLISLTGNYENGSNHLYWNTSNIKEIASFDIEKSINAASGFEKIAEMKAQEDYHYDFEDSDCNETAFYRITGKHFDGQFIYSNLIQLKGRNVTHQYSLFPNPLLLGTPLTFNAALLEKGSYAIELINSIGRIVNKKEVNHNGGHFACSITTNKGYFKGGYIFVLRDKRSGEVIYRKELVIQ